MRKIVMVFVLMSSMSFSLLYYNNEFFMDEKKEINGKLYYVEIRKYSFGGADTTYIRKSDVNYLQFNRITNSESILLPLSPKIGDNWLENDGSWKYEVIEVDKTFKTPIKSYEDCILVSCKQLTNRDLNKNEEYLIYYSKDFGFVGNVDKENNILSYLKEIKLNKKNGDKVRTK